MWDFIHMCNPTRGCGQRIYEGLYTFGIWLFAFWELSNKHVHNVFSTLDSHGVFKFVVYYILCICYMLNHRFTENVASITKNKNKCYLNDTLY